MAAFQKGLKSNPYKGANQRNQPAENDNEDFAQGPPGEIYQAATRAGNARRAADAQLREAAEIHSQADNREQPPRLTRHGHVDVDADTVQERIRSDVYRSVEEGISAPDDGVQAEEDFEAEENVPVAEGSRLGRTPQSSATQAGLNPEPKVTRFSTPAIATQRGHTDATGGDILRDVEKVAKFVDGERGRRAVQLRFLVSIQGSIARLIHDMRSAEADHL